METKEQGGRRKVGKHGIDCDDPYCLGECIDPRIQGKSIEAQEWRGADELPFDDPRRSEWD